MRRVPGATLSGGRKVWVGVDIGGTKTAVVISAKPPEILSRVEFPTRPEMGPEQAIEQIKGAIRECLRGHGLELAEVERIGISCGGPLNRREGLIQGPPNLSTWIDVPICSILGTEFEVACALENDANAGAVAEHRFGAGRGAETMIFLTLGTGIGAGLIIEGCLYHGASEMAGEIGHVRMTRTGPIGYGKAGSVEGWVSGYGMAQTARRTVRRAVERGEPTVLAGLWSDGGMTSRDVGVAAEEGDEVARRIVRRTGQRLGAALAIFVDVINPERIVIGGLAVRLGEMLLGPARRVLAREALPASVSACEVVPAMLGEGIGDVAALCVAMGPASSPDARRVVWTGEGEAVQMGRTLGGA